MKTRVVIKEKMAGHSKARGFSPIENGVKYKRTKEKLKEFEDKFTAAFHASPNLLAITQIDDGTIVEVNEGYTKMLGYSRAESLGKTTGGLAIWANPTDRVRFARHLKKYGEVTNFETTLRRKDGTLLTVSDSARTVVFQNKTHILSVATDITEFKRIQRELARLNRSLRMINEINQALVRVTDENRLLKKVCQIMVKAGGYRLAWVGFAERDKDKTVRPVAHAGFGEKYVMSARITWADTKRGQGPGGKAIRTRQPVVARDIANDPSMTPWRKDARKFGYQSIIALPLGNEGQVIGVIGIYAAETDAFNAQEIAILEEMSNDLAFGIATLRARKEIEKRVMDIDLLKTTFIRIVSHQLRTPLSVIRWSLESLLERKRGMVPPEQEILLRGMYEANSEVISRIEDLMVAMDIEEKRLTLNLETMDAAEIIQSACEEALIAGTLKQITHKITTPKTSLPSVRIDVAKIQNVISRMIDNAIAYTKDKGNIVVAYYAKNGNVRFEVSDTGIGIPSHDQPHVFERFYRGTNAATMRPNASGLGLFISKCYIDAHHGTIGFSSTEKKGSTFWFELPVAPKSKS